MAVQDEDSFKRYAANGIATVYAIPFLLLNEADLQVVLNGTVVTVGFTVSGVGTNTGSITFSVAPSGDLLLQRVVPFERLTDYQDNGDLLADTVNRDFDRLWLAMQELRRDDSTALRTSSLEPEGIPNLPLANQRASRVLAFDPSGDPVVSSLTIDELEQQPALAIAAADAAVAAAGAASSSASASSTSATAAANSATAAEQAKDKAQQWAEEDEDVPVEPGLFSAKHWAAKAMAALSGLLARVVALENIGKPFTKEYVSTPQPVVFGGLVTVNHGFGSRPKTVKVSYVVVVAFSGYSIGEEIDPDGVGFYATGGTTYGKSITSTTTQILVRNAQGLLLLDKNTGAASQPAASSLNLIVRAWA